MQIARKSVSLQSPVLRIAQAIEPERTVVDPHIEQIQEWLVWTGYYDGPLDGSAGTGTITAVKGFQQAVGAQMTGALTTDQSTTLQQRAEATIQLVGFGTVTDPSTGIRIGLPLALVAQKSHGPGTVSYASSDGTIDIELRSFQYAEDLKDVVDQVKNGLAGVTLSYSALRANWFVLAGDADNRRFYLRLSGNSGTLAGFLIVYDKSLTGSEGAALSAVVSMMSLAE